VTADVEALREKVDRCLRESALGASPDATGDYMLAHGNVITWLRPMAWKDDRTLLRVWSITNVEMAVTGELTRFLVATNAKVAFGGFHLDERRPSVLMAHSLLGDYLNREELLVALAAVTGTADRFAPEIRQRFGGKLFTDP
jgi:hypothetical protein